MTALATALLCVAALLSSCAAPAADRQSAAAAATAASPRTAVACAWFGDARDSTLYFGISSFWAALREAGGDPTAETRTLSARELGRFDLARRRMLPALAIGPPDAKSGVWDVLAHPNGWVYFTTFFEHAGRVDPVSGRVEWFAGAGAGLNELALGPRGSVLATRYGQGGASGAVVVLDERGALLAEHALLAEAGIVAAAKSLAYDPVRDAVWVNTDLLPVSGGGAAPTHDVRVLAFADGRELARWSAPELQFMAFSEDGTGLLVERSEELLRLRVLPPRTEAQPQWAGRLIPLDDAFPALDFAQDLKLAPDGSAIVTRWSGSVHVISPDGEVRDSNFPRRDDGLYYSAVQRGRELCATHCGGVEVICASAPK